MKQLAWQDKDGNRELPYFAFLSPFHYLLTIFSNFLFQRVYWFTWWGPFYKFFFNLDIALNRSRKAPVLQVHLPCETEHPQGISIGHLAPGVNHFLRPYIPSSAVGSPLKIRQFALNSKVTSERYRASWQIFTSAAAYVRPKFCLYEHKAKCSASVPVSLGISRLGNNLIVRSPGIQLDRWTVCYADILQMCELS